MVLSAPPLVAPRWRLPIVTCALVAVLLPACSSGEEGAGIAPASADPRSNVMVIDQGIDLAAAELRGRVAAAFTLTCVTAPAPTATNDDTDTDCRSGERPR